MSKAWHIAYVGLITILVSIMLLRDSQRHDQMNALSDLDDAYRRSIRHAGAWLAERQAEIGHATYLCKGIEMLNPEPVSGHPLCQLGCVLSSEHVAGIEVNAETELIAGYNHKLDTLKKTKGPNNTSDGIRQPADGLPKPSM